MSARRVVGACGLGALLALGPATTHHSAAQAPSDGALVDLHGAVIVISARATPRERKAVQLLVDQVQRRTQVTLPVQTSWPAAGRAVISVARIGTLPGGGPASPTAGLATPGAEGFQLAASATGSAAQVAVAGADERGVLFGVGRLLRELRLARGAVGAGGGPASVHDATNAPARASARLPAQDQLVRRLDRRDVGAVHRRSGGIRHQRDRADPAQVRRRRRQPALHAAADGDDGRDVAHGRRLRPRRLDLVSRARQGLRRPSHCGSGGEGVGRGFQASAARRRRPGAGRRPRPHRASAHVRAPRAPDREPAPVSPERDDVAVAARLHRGLDEPVLRLDGDASRPG